jgi:hypothetical protein
MKELATFMDGEGRLKAWPSRKKRSVQLLALSWLAAKFERGRDYTEFEVNAILNEHHTFGDWALLRREMFELGLLCRTPDVRRYWLPEPPPHD